MYLAMYIMIAEPDELDELDEPDSDSTDDNKSIGTGAIVGIIVGALVLMFVVAFILFILLMLFFKYRQKSFKINKKSGKFICFIRIQLKVAFL